MKSVLSIKKKIELLYKNKASLHLNMTIPHSKTRIKKMRGRISGVYPNIFTFKAICDGAEKSYAIQYSEVLMGSVEIAELKS